MRRDYLPYCRPALEEDDIQAVVRTLRSGWLTTGPSVVEFQREFAAAAGARHAIALSSCTAALHVGLLAAGVGPGHEVITPSLSFVAGANTIRQVGATPVFCDVEATSLCATPENIAPLLTGRTKAVMTMHFAGRPDASAPIVELCKPRGIAVIEDAALAVGTLDDGRWPGSRTDAAAYSFYATKNVTTAEGGMLVTDDDAFADRVRVLGLHGMDRDAWKRYERGGAWRYDVVAVGYKYNMPDIAAVLGLGQLRKLPKLQRRREEIALRYLDALDAIPGASAAAMGRMGARDRHSWCVFPIAIDAAEAGIERDDTIEALKHANIGTSVHYIPSHLFTAYKDAPHGPLPVTESEWRRLISLPLYPSMTDDDVTDVICGLRDAIPAAQPSRGARTIR
jgi:dTDP-4-amino-4,6-dideoxygalactose transaminase